MGTIKDRNGMDLTEAEDIMKRVARMHSTTFLYSCKNYTKKIFMSQISTMM